MKYLKYLSFLLLITFIGCAEPEKNSTSLSNETIKIGVIMPLTGPVAEPGNNALRGIELAFNNYSDSSKIKFELIVEDSKSNPREGVSAINKLIQFDNTQIIIGDIMSSVFLAMAPIAERNQVVLISPGASAPSVREAGDYIFRNYLSDDFDGRVMANYIYEQGINRVGIISVNNDYGVGVKESFEEEMQSLGGNLVFNEQYEQGETSFQTLLTRIRDNNAEAIYMVSNPAEAGHLIRQIGELRIEADFFGNLSFESNEFIDIAGGTFEEITFSAPYFNLDEDKQVTRTFVNTYDAEYDRKPDVAAALGYDTALILIEALSNSSFDVRKVKEELYRINNFDGITGNTTIDDKGDVIKDIYIKKITGDGNIDILELYSISK